MTESSAIETQLIEAYASAYPDECVSLAERFPASELISFLQSLSYGYRRALLPRLRPDILSQLLPKLDETTLENWFAILELSKLAPLYLRLSNEQKSRLKKALTENQLKTLETWSKYPPDRAAFFMDTQVLLFRSEHEVREAIERLQGQTEKKITDLYLVNGDNQLEGVLPLQKMVAASSETKLGDIANKNPVQVLAMAAKEEVVEVMDTHKVASLPVVDADRHFLGVLRYDALVDVLQQEALHGMPAMVGASPDEKALSKATFAVRKRMPWLAINLLTTFLAAFVVGLFEETIAQITALAVLLPVVAGQSGNTGAQSQAVVLRGIALREFSPLQWWRVVRKEILVGFLNGLGIGVVATGAIFLWSQSWGLSLIMGLSMVTAMTAASFSGAAIPVLLSKLGQDPAQSSSILLTTITDIVGFTIFLGLAATLSYLI